MKDCWKWSISLGKLHFYVTYNQILKNRSKTKYGTHYRAVANENKENKEFVCRVCGKKMACKGNITIHHVLPRAIFPKEIYDDPRNMIPVCIDCHKAIHSRQPFLNTHLITLVAKEMNVDLTKYYTHVK